MSARCQITGRTVGFGKAVSHSHRRTRRRWPPISSSRPTTYRRRTAASRCGSAPKESRSSTATGIEAVVARLGQDPPRRTSRAKRAHRSERRRSCEHN